MAKWLQGNVRREYPLVNPDEPNLLREWFPYSEPPRILFDGLDVPMDPPDDIFITDTTFRDGQQARPPYTVTQIERLYEMLHRLGGPNGVIRQSEFFLYSEKDQAAVRKCQEKGYRYPEITGWIRASKKDFKVVKELGLKETGILTSASDYHIYLKLGWDRKIALQQYLEVVETSLEHGVVARCHFEDVTRADIEGFIIPFAQRLMRLSEEAKVPVKIRLCDTMGYGVPYPGAGLPRSVPRLVHALIHEAGVPKEQLEWHGHNDFYKVLINGSYAWLYGAAAVSATVMGFGERTGNTPIEGALFEYAGLTGSLNGADPRVITEIKEYLEKECNYQVPPMTPFVGENFNVTAAGIHADGLIKNEEIYNIFDTGAILGRPLGINITDKTGLAGVAFWLNHRFGLQGDEKIDKRDPRVAKINEWVEAEFRAGRTNVISSEEMLEQARLHFPELFQKKKEK